jgi:hypothetical protein
LFVAHAREYEKRAIRRVTKLTDAVIAKADNELANRRFTVLLADLAEIA